MKLLLQGMIVAAAAVTGAATERRLDPPEHAVAAGAVGIKKINGKEVVMHVLAVGPTADAAKAHAKSKLKEKGAKVIKNGYRLTRSPKLSRFNGGALNRQVAPLYNPNNEPNYISNGQDRVEAGADWWNGVDGSNFAVDTSFSTTTSTIASACNTGPDSEFVVGWNDIDAGDRKGITLAWCCYFRYDTEDADIEFNSNSNLNWNNFDLTTIAAHEFGHMWKIAHTRVLGALMYPRYNGPMTGLKGDDKNALIKLYPAGGDGGGSGGGGGGGAPPRCKNKCWHPKCAQWC